MNRQDEAADVGASAAGGQSSGAGSIAQGQYSTATPARQPKHGRVSDGVWRKWAKPSIHLLRKPTPAWAVDVDDLEVARQSGAASIEIVDTEWGDVYCCTISHFLAHATRLNRGAGEQAALPLSFWRRCGKGDASAGDGPRQARLRR